MNVDSMPLPPALLEKLAKRGIVKEEKKPEEEEEVFAENYDESEESSDSSEDEDQSDNDDSENSDKNETESKNSEAIKPKESLKNNDCPNTNNPYHECTSYCRKKYGEKIFEPHPVMEKRRIRMLKIYPLLPNWKEVPDLNTNRYYYWNTETDQVCWLSPSHPKAKYEYHPHQSKTSEAIKRLTHEGSETTDSEPDINLHSSLVAPYRDNKSKGGQSYYHKKNKNAAPGPADPMDPSSYGDCKKGKWSDGIDQPSAKIGSSVDEN